MIRPAMRAFVAALTLFTLVLPAQAEIEIQEVTSPGGIKAWLVEEPSIPFMALELRFRGGASLDAPGKRGATYLMTGLLEEGAGEMDAQAFSIAVESLAAEFRFDAHNDAVSISAKALTENRDEAMELLRQALVEPRFDEDAIERVRGQVLSGIDADTRDPDAISANTFYSLAFGDHPYGTSLEGTVESVTALTRDDLIEARDRTLSLDHLYVAAVGDITAEELGDLLDRLLGELPETGAPRPERIDYTLAGGTTVVDFDTPQSVVTFGQRGITRHDPDFFPAYVLTHILGGGGFSSRLMEEVREKRGLTYGVGAYLYPMDYSEMLVGNVSTVNARVGETISVIRDEWAKLATEGVTEEELERAKTYLTGAYPLRFDGNGPIANILVGMQMDDLTPEYVVTRNDKIRAVTLEDVRRVASELIDPDGLHFIVVGQPEGLDASN